MSFTGKPDLTTQDPVQNDSFWPNLEMADLLTGYRIPAEYADDVIITGLILAIIRVNEQMAAVKAVMQAQGYATLTAYTDANPDLINGQAVLLIEYKNAVFARAKAGLLQQFNSLNRKDAAENPVLESPDTERYWLDQSQQSIKRFFSHFLPDEVVFARANTQVTLL